MNEHPGASPSHDAADIFTSTWRIAVRLTELAECLFFHMWTVSNAAFSVVGEITARPGISLLRIDDDGDVHGSICV